MDEERMKPLRDFPWWSVIKFFHCCDAAGWVTGGLKTRTKGSFVKPASEKPRGI